MAELAQEMLESDQKVGEFKNEREDPVFSMNNLKEIPFSDFLILHKIFPKILGLYKLKSSKVTVRKTLRMILSSRSQTWVARIWFDSGWT